MLRDLALRKARKGGGWLPPNPKRWEHEHNALDLRHALSLPVEAQLPHLEAFRLMPHVHVMAHRALPLEPDVANHFSGSNARKWSGMGITCAGGAIVVIYNDAHPNTRIRATLMEEFFHLWLGHPPTRLRVLASGEGGRDYDGAKEAEAYGSGAAALVPYKALRAMLVARESRHRIADHFLVSEQLVDFRIRVSKLASLVR